MRLFFGIDIHLAAWDDLKILPDPPSFPEFDIALPNPSARSLHFLPEDNILLVTYLDHGIAWVYAFALGIAFSLKCRLS